jgi:hypothetical protein
MIALSGIFANRPSCTFDFTDERKYPDLSHPHSRGGSATLRQVKPKVRASDESFDAL